MVEREKLFQHPTGRPSSYDFSTPISSPTTLRIVALWFSGTRTVRGRLSGDTVANWYYAPACSPTRARNT